jgi:sugar lactone lactonase YvrE
MMAGAAMSALAVMGASFTSPVRPSVLLSLAVGDTSPAFRRPTGIALDHRGAVYVASAGDASVAVFAPGAKGRVAPVRRISGRQSGLISPRGLALGSKGEIYVSDQSHKVEGRGSITVYAPRASGNAVPTHVIAGPHTGLDQPVAIALGSDSTIYVANRSGNPVIAFNARAEGDVERPLNISVSPDTTTPADSTAPAAIPGKEFKLANGNRAVIQLFPEDQAVFQQQRRDATASLPRFYNSPRASDIAIGKGGTLLLVNAQGLSFYDKIGPHSRVVFAKSDSAFPFSDFGRGQPLIALGPGGELYVARKSAPATNPDPPGSKPNPMSMLDSFFGGPQQISVYPSGEGSDTTPVRTIAGKRADLGRIGDLAVGPDGSLFVLRSGPMQGDARIQVYAPNAAGDIPPVRVVSGPNTGMKQSTSIAVDGSGEIYVANDLISRDRVTSAATITVYAPNATGDAIPIRTITGFDTRMSRPTGIAVAADGTLYVANSGVWNDDHGSVKVYRAAADDGELPIRTLMKIGTEFLEPAGLAVGRDDTLYVISAAPFIRRVTVYPPEADGEVGPLRTLEGGHTELESPSGLALDRGGRLYVSDRREASGLNAYGPDLGAIRIYDAGANRDEAPVRTIVGSFTRLNGPGGLAIDRVGNVYVPNYWGTGPGSVTVYGPEADGDVRPLRMIAGPATGLQSPAAVALGERDTLYVLNAASITVYAPGVRGNAAPVRTIEAR